MASGESRGFHRLCNRFLPFLLTACPMGNRHFLWQTLCECGVGEYSGDHRSDTYRLNWMGLWRKVPKEDDQE